MEDQKYYEVRFKQLAAWALQTQMHYEGTSVISS